MPMNPINYVGDDAETYRNFNALPEEHKNGHVWDSDDISIVNIKKAIKDHYIVSQDYTCPYCKQRLVVNHNATWDAEHIIPKSSHPKFIFEPLNLCVSCKDCNNEKRDKAVLRNNRRRTFPVNSEDYKFVHPHFDNYNEHINIVEVAGYYFPLTEKGRKTIEKCGLLRFAYKYTGYGNTSQENKETIRELTNRLMEAGSAAEENMLLSIIADAVQAGQRLSKDAFLQQIGAQR
ncbi:HNH endonuclease [Pseudescherichia sp.]|uniref:HNH endonuclease n=1 Tax=Pseudescherichia sp. TaxID=2055881 RepID=UPI00289840E7|nr:HNH endonuclease [Pseudescherichia sp.]